MMWRFGIVLLTAALLGGCGGAENQEEAPLETVDVGPGLEVSTEDDPQEKPRREGLVGELPGGFPADLAIYLPASLVDLGDAAGERRMVALLSPHGVAAVSENLETSLRQKGWQLGAPQGGRRLLSKGGRQVWLEIGEGQPGTLYRYEYLPE